MEKSRQCPCNGECRNCTACHFLQYPELVESSSCMECRYKTSPLYFCLTCGHIGCDTRNQGHALEHHRKIKHALNMGLENFNVRDYGKISYLSSLKDLELQLSVNHKAADCNCPVCRYHQIPRLSDVTTCMSCGETKNLWLCLNCRYIGCGRQQNGHGLHHYQRTEHCRVMQLQTFQIWDYNEHKYVHRLYESESPTDFTADVSVSKSLTQQDQDFERRMKRLEDEWHNFSTLKETNLQMISIEQRLITLSEEKKMFEEKLREHDNKLNELLNQFKGNQQQDIFTKFTDRNHNMKNQNDVGSMESINEQPNSNSEDKPLLTVTVSENFEPSEWIHLSLLVILFLYNFLYLFIKASSENA